MMTQAVEGTWICTGSCRQLRGEWVNEVGFRKSYFQELRSRKLHYLKYEQKGFFKNFDSINISHSVFDPIR